MMLSRMAEALYWMSRNLERADNTARLLQTNLMHLVGSGDAAFGDQWAPLLTITGSGPAFDAFAGNEDATRDNVVPYMTQERTNPNSIYNSIRLARENARVVRDSISREMWESLNQTWLWSESALQNPLSPDRAPAFYSQLRGTVARFQGLTDGTMMNGESYGFHRLGMFIERADMTARILDVKYHILLPSVAEVGSPLDYYQWGVLLKSVSGFEAYRRLHHIGIRPVDVTEFVVFNEDFPRSLIFCTMRMAAALDQIGESASPSSRRAIHELINMLTDRDPEDVFQSGLHEFLQEFLRRVATLHGAIQSDFFDPKLGAAHALQD